MTISRRDLLQTAAGATLMAAFAPHDPRVQAAESGRPVRFAWWTDVGRPTPFQVSTTGPGGAALLTLLYDTLTWKDEAGIIPWLASEWTVAGEGTLYSFRINEGATWHDGTPLTAEDVAFSFHYYAEHPYVWTSTQVVESAAAVSEREATIRLKHPFAPFLEEIAGTVPIIPGHVWDDIADPREDTRREGLIGSGPFALAEYDATAGSYRLTANDRYWRGRPRVPEWRQILVPAETQLAAIRQDEIDVALSIDASVGEVLARDERLRIFETAPLSMVRLLLNPERAPLDRREVRQAIVHALDRARIAETITRGPAIVGSAGVVPPETPWFNPDLPEYRFDTERAKSLLGGESFDIDLLADASAREPDLIAPMLEAVGIRPIVRRADAPTRAEIVADGDFGLVLTGHIGGGGDPDYLRRWFTGEEANAFARGPVFQNEEYARLAEEQAAALDPEVRRGIVYRMQEILAEELPTIVLYHRRFYWIHDPAVFAPMATWGGLLNGVPFPTNKLALIAT